MNDTFLKLAPNRQEHILKAICEEFTEHSYEDASTNRIVEKAGISKGTLFNYFGCKEGMHNAVLEHAWNFFKDNGVHNFATNDFLERCYIIADMKMKIYEEHSYLMDFLVKLHLTDSPHVPEKIKIKINEMMRKSAKKLYENVDLSRFKDGTDPQVMMRLIRYTFDGFMQEITNRMKITELTNEVFESILADHYKLLQEMKKIYYK